MSSLRLPVFAALTLSVLGCRGDANDRSDAAAAPLAPVVAPDVVERAARMERPDGDPTDPGAHTVTASVDGPSGVEEAVVPRDDPAYEKPPAADAKAWDSAPKLATARSPKDCEARVLGRFVRVQCEGHYASYSESIAGEPDTVQFAHRDPKWSQDYSKLVRTSARAAVFPLAPGERRVLQFADLFGGWRTPWTASTDVVVSAYWLEDEALPTVVID